MRISGLAWCPIVLFVSVTNVAPLVIHGPKGTLTQFLHNKTEPEIYVPPVMPGENHEICERPFPLAVNNKQRLATQFQRSGIVPLLIPVPPKKLLKVEYWGLPNCQPFLGNYVDVCGLTDAPQLKWKCNPNKLYTLWLIDVFPLGESRPSLLARGILWWVVDIPGCDVEAGMAIYEYQPPLPLYGSGRNLYAFGVFEQPSYQIDWSEEAYVPATSERHRYYHEPALITKYDVKLVASNFYYTEFKPCVEEGLDNLDEPAPQYVTKSVERADLPADPYLLFGRGMKHFSLKAERNQNRVHIGHHKSHRVH